MVYEHDSLSGPEDRCLSHCVVSLRADDKAHESWSRKYEKEHADQATHVSVRQIDDKLDAQISRHRESLFKTLELHKCLVTDTALAQSLKDFARHHEHITTRTSRPEHVASVQPRRPYSPHPQAITFPTGPKTRGRARESTDSDQARSRSGSSKLPLHRKKKPQLRFDAQHHEPRFEHPDIDVHPHKYSNVDQFLKSFPNWTVSNNALDIGPVAIPAHVEQPNGSSLNSYGSRVFSMRPEDQDEGYAMLLPTTFAEKVHHIMLNTHSRHQFHINNRDLDL